MLQDIELGCNSSQVPSTLTAQPINAEEIPWVPLREGLAMRPLCFLDDGYSLQLRLEPGTVISPHRHTGEVNALNLAGWRRVLDSNELVGPGAFLHEPPGNADSWACEGDEPCIVQISLKGRVEYLDPLGKVEDYSDSYTAQAAYLEFCQAQGMRPDSRLFQGAFPCSCP